MEITIEMNDDSNKEVSKFSDAVSKISNLEMQFATFNAYLNEINRTAQKEASKNSKALKDILALLQGGGCLINQPNFLFPLLRLTSNLLTGWSQKVGWKSS
jgi:hypothetical protein